MTDNFFKPFASEEEAAPFNAQWEARRRVGDALKQIIDEAGAPCWAPDAPSDGPCPDN